MVRTPSALPILRNAQKAKTLILLVGVDDPLIRSPGETRQNQCPFPKCTARSTHCKALKLLERLTQLGNRFGRLWDLARKSTDCGPATCPSQNAPSRSADCGRATIEHDCRRGVLHCSRVRHSSGTPRTVHGHGPRRGPARGRRQDTRVRNWSRALTPWWWPFKRIPVSLGRPRSPRREASLRTCDGAHLRRWMLQRAMSLTLAALR
jgi:hypothetical protein